MGIIRRAGVVSGDRVLLPTLSHDERRRAGMGVPGAASDGMTPSLPSVGDPEALRLAREAREAEERATLRDAARAEGYAAGLDEARAAMREVTTRLEALVEGLRRTEAAAYDGLADRVTELVFEAVVKIVGEQSRTAAGIGGIVRTAIAAAREGAQVRRVRLAPDDLSLVRSEAPELLEAWKSQEVEAVADARVQLGGCIVEGERGNVDARLETQLERLREALIEARGRLTTGNS